MIAANKDTSVFLFDRAGEAGARSVVAQRNSKDSPFNPACPIHLRRICGVCAHFTGEGMRSRGGCALKGVDVMGTYSAGKCGAWSRKWAGGAA